MTTFALETDPQRSSENFNTWYTAMTEHAVRRNGVFWLQAERIAILTRRKELPSGLARYVKLAFDRTDAPWAVELNEPSKLGVGDGESSIALDEDNQPWLLRQGNLKRKNQPPIDGEAFRLATGLAQAEVTNSIRDRRWYRVARLNQPPEQIRRETAFFVTRCAGARDRYTEHQDERDTAVVEQLYGGPENANPYLNAPKAATAATMVRNWQGEVWHALEAELAKYGKKSGSHGQQ
jgi:hypothetical protein